MFRNYPATSMLSNNANEIVVKIQQGGVMNAVKGQRNKYATSIGTDSTGLCRWIYIAIVNDTKNRNSCLLSNVCDQKRNLLQ